jgi:hypothetical protein
MRKESPAVDASTHFLREHAGKHFVFLSGRVHRSGVKEPAKLFHASGFVVEVEEHWFFVTAGHVINAINELEQSGYAFDSWMLEDKSAGHDFPFGVPITFDPRLWIVFEIESRGLDYAAFPLIDLWVQALRVGGVRAIDETTWLPIPIEECKDWLLVGIPRESITHAAGRFTLKLTLIPVLPAEPPYGAESKEPNRYYAKIKDGPDGHLRIEDVDGMSGGPIFGTKLIEGRLKYWAIGVQSGFFEKSRIISFCPLAGFLLELKNVIVGLKARGAIE